MPEPERVLTYEELMALFRKRNVDLANLIKDYRPHPGEYALQVWLKDGRTFYIRWIKEIEQFVFGEVEPDKEYGAQTKRPE